jgi:hypothetical protein
VYIEGTEDTEVIEDTELQTIEGTELQTSVFRTLEN